LNISKEEYSQHRKVIQGRPNHDCGGWGGGGGERGFLHSLSKWQDNTTTYQKNYDIIINNYGDFSWILVTFDNSGETIQNMLLFFLDQFAIINYSTLIQEEKEHILNWFSRVVKGNQYPAKITVSFTNTNTLTKVALLLVGRNAFLLKEGCFFNLTFTIKKKKHEKHEVILPASQLHSKTWFSVATN